MTVPDWLSDDDILSYKLLELELESRNASALFTRRFLTHCLGAAFQSDEFRGDDIVTLIEALVGEEAETAFTQYPNLLLRCIEDCCEICGQNSRVAWIQQLCVRLPGNVEEVWHYLSLWAALYSYPGKLLEYTLTPEQAAFVRQVPSDALRGLLLEPDAEERVQEQLTIFFNDIRSQVTSSEECRKLVEFASGLFPFEFHEISGIFNSGRFAPTIEDVRAVQQKFHSCRGLSAMQLKSLDYCVRPARPALISRGEKRGWREWVQWAQEEYIPYRHWQVHNNYVDAELELTVQSFSAWFLEEYGTIHSEPKLSLVYCLNALSMQAAEIEFSLILLIDCLPLTFMEILDNAFRNIGLHRHSQGCRFAALPS